MTATHTQTVMASCPKVTTYQLSGLWVAGIEPAGDFPPWIIFMRGDGSAVLHRSRSQSGAVLDFGVELPRVPRTVQCHHFGDPLPAPDGSVMDFTAELVAHLLRTRADEILTCGDANECDARSTDTSKSFPAVRPRDLLATPDPGSFALAAGGVR